MCAFVIRHVYVSPPPPPPRTAVASETNSSLSYDTLANYTGICFMRNSCAALLNIISLAAFNSSSKKANKFKRNIKLTKSKIMWEIDRFVNIKVCYCLKHKK